MKQKGEIKAMEALENKKEPDFWTCKHGYFAGECRCRLRVGDNLCPLENEGICADYDYDEK